MSVIHSTHTQGTHRVSTQITHYFQKLKVKNSRNTKPRLENDYFKRYKNLHEMIFNCPRTKNRKKYFP